MEILVYGDKRLKVTKYFKCPKCGAVWTAHQGEYGYNRPIPDTYYVRPDLDEGYFCGCAMKWCSGFGKEITHEEAVKAHQQSYNEPYRQGV